MSTRYGWGLTPPDQPGTRVRSSEWPRAQALPAPPTSTSPPPRPERLDLPGRSSYSLRKMKVGTRLTSKGQVVIPKPVRDRLRWRTGTRLEVEALPDGALHLTPAADDPIARLAGCLRDGDPLADLEAEHRAEVDRDARQRRRR